MRRRQFISLLGGAATAWPLAARAQQAAMPVVGYLYPGSPEAFAAQVAAFRKGLAEAGYVDGRNVSIDYRFANDDTARLPELAADLVRRRVAVIATPGSTSAALTAKAATTTIPIVFSSGVDPVDSGLVTSLNRPGGNVTGISSMNIELGAKRLGLLHELLPRAERFAALVSPAGFASATADLQAAASSIGRPIEFLAAATNRDIEAAFATFAQKRIDALLVTANSLFDNRRAQLVTLAQLSQLGEKSK